MLQALRDFVSDSDRRLSDIERRAGYGPGYLQQVLAGAIELKVAHLEEILAAIEVPPSHFWPRLLPLSLRQAKKRLAWRPTTKRRAPHTSRLA